jgi:nardilysin
MFTLFTINVTLTEEGYKNLEEVLDAIFSFLLLLKPTSIEEHEKYFMELKQIRETSFKYREEKTSSDNVEELAVNMKYYEASDIITGSKIFFEFDGKIIEDLINILNERKFNILVLTDKHVKYEKTEKR